MGNYLGFQCLLLMQALYHKGFIKLKIFSNFLVSYAELIFQGSRIISRFDHVMFLLHSSARDKRNNFNNFLLNRRIFIFTL